LPSITPRSTSFSRAVSDSRRRFQLALFLIGGVTKRSQFQRTLHAIEHLLRVIRLLDEINRAVLQSAHRHWNIAVTADENDRQRRTRRFSSACTSKPLCSGMRTSRTRHAGTPGSKALRNSFALAKPADFTPTDSSSHASDVRMPLSSSTI
jgi:hypothetical protein